MTNGAAAGQTDTAGNLFRIGRLAEAVTAAGLAVRKAPGDLSARVFLAELLLLAGNLERADTILDAASTIDPSATLAVAEFRQLLRAETARRQLFVDGRVPEFLADPTPSQQALLAGLVALRAGDLAAAAEHAATAETLRPPATGHAGTLTANVTGHAGTLTSNVPTSDVTGQAGTGRFDDLRDADDLLAGTLEVLTTTGKYYWIPIERVAEIVFHPPKRARDLAWRRASMQVTDGPDGDVYLPVIYAPAGSAGPEVDDRFKLGRETDWLELAPGLVRGVGQRLFMLGEEAIGIMELDTLSLGA